jgi:mannose-6-phosphate isomerase class I
MIALGEEMKQGHLSAEEGRAKGLSIAKAHDPWRFVNVIESEKDDIVDLSACALHHSWEEDEDRIPQGNIVYELQADVDDSVSSIRGFDKGKISGDGSLRPVHIDDYFRLIDRDPDFNKPERHMRQALTVRDDDSVRVKRAIDSEWYSLEIACLSGRSSFEHDASSYRHVFVRRGTIAIETAENQIKVGSGHSAFIPASANSYSMESLGGEAEALITFIS